MAVVPALSLMRRTKGFRIGFDAETIGLGLSMSSALHRMRSFGRNAVGATAVEFALAAPILFLLMFAVIEFGRAWWAKNSLQYAVERATRYAVVCATGACPSDDTVKTYAANQAYDQGVNSNAFSVTHPAGALCVSYSYQYTPWFVGDYGPLAGIMTFTGTSCRAHS
jgi:Flp pilus assembly pilin Flp